MGPLFASAVYRTSLHHDGGVNIVVSGRNEPNATGGRFVTDAFESDEDMENRSWRAACSNELRGGEAS